MSADIYPTQHHAIAAGGTPVGAHEGETLEEYWEFTHFRNDPGETRAVIRATIEANGCSITVDFSKEGFYPSWAIAGKWHTGLRRIFVRHQGATSGASSYDVMVERNT